ncbi:MAG: cell division protein ZapA [Rhodobacteraceae bacterium]|nr:cell division protein ZapA [Paracoccaceae bacterium]
MAEVKVSIGDREFEVACRDGEEGFLLSAAELLNNEAVALKESLGRLPENRMLLMAGLMVADKTASLEDRLKSGQVVEQGDEQARKRVKDLEKQLGRVQAALAEANSRLSEAGTNNDAQKMVIRERDSAIAVLQRLVEKAEAAARAQMTGGGAEGAVQSLAEKAEAAARG